MAAMAAIAAQTHLTKKDEKKDESEYDCDNSGSFSQVPSESMDVLHDWSTARKQDQTPKEREMATKASQRQHSHGATACKYVVPVTPAYPAYQQHRSTCSTRCEDEFQATSSNKLSLMQEIKHAFTACHEDLSHHHEIDFVPKFSAVKDVFSKAVHGDLGALREVLLSRPRSNINNTYSLENASFISYRGSDDDESQLRRLASWGTNGTSATSVSAETVATSLPSAVQEENINSIREKTEKAETAKWRKNRIVKFDYPPISSLREYPRPQPDELERMFFSEHELEQIEDDRFSTISADDVEIVAISTSSDSCCPKNDPYSPPRRDSNFKNYVSTPKNRKNNKKPSFGFTPEELSKRRNHSNNSEIFREHSSRGQGGPSSSPNRARSSPMRRHQQNSEMNSDTHEDQVRPEDPSRPPRMLKSVQIYLRERSLK